MHPFIGRTSEIQTLNTYQQRHESALLIVYGRRRVGKTRLLTHWLQTTPIPMPCIGWRNPIQPRRNCANSRKRFIGLNSQKEPC